MVDAFHKMNIQQSEDASEAIAVSILIPVYGVEDYIERCARSVFEQTYSNIEYIFCDDCSPDHSISVLRRVMKDYPHRAKHTRILKHKKNRGLAAARNTLVEVCQTDWLMHVDSDDWVEPSAVEHLVNRQLETSADIVSGDFIFERQEGAKCYHSQEYQGIEAVLDILAEYTPKRIWGRLIDINLYRNYHLRAQEGCDIGEDWQVMVPLTYYAKKMAVCPEPLIHYTCTNAHSLSFGTDSFSVTYFWQLQQTVDIIRAFLVDKERYYLLRLNSTERQMLRKQRIETILKGRKDVYRIIQQRMSTLRKRLELFSVKECLKSNYYLYRLSLKLVNRN